MSDDQSWDYDSGAFAAVEPEPPERWSPSRVNELRAALAAEGWLGPNAPLGTDQSLADLDRAALVRALATVGIDVTSPIVPGDPVAPYLTGDDEPPAASS